MKDEPQIRYAKPGEDPMLDAAITRAPRGARMWRALTRGARGGQVRAMGVAAACVMGVAAVAFWAGRLKGGGSVGGAEVESAGMNGGATTTSGEVDAAVSGATNSAGGTTTSATSATSSGSGATSAATSGTSNGSHEPRTPKGSGDPYGDEHPRPDGTSTASPATTEPAPIPAPPSSNTESKPGVSPYGKRLGDED